MWIPKGFLTPGVCSRTWCREPERSLFRSLWTATALVGLLYLGLNSVFVLAAPPAELSGRADIGAVAAQALGGSGLRRALSALVVVALFTSISSMSMAGTNVSNTSATASTTSNTTAE